MTLVRCVATIEDSLSRVAGDGRMRVMSYSEHDGWPNREGRTGPTERRVDFSEALTNPPVCHGLPMATLGGWMLALIADRMRTHGVVPLECERSGNWCLPHNFVPTDWGGRNIEWLNATTCPHQRIVALIRRRHGLYDGQPLAAALVDEYTQSAAAAGVFDG